MNRVIRNTAFYLLLFLLAFGILRNTFGQNEPAKELTYNQLVHVAENGEIQSMALQIQNGTYYITGEFKPKNGKTESFIGHAPLAEFVLKQFSDLSLRPDKGFELTSKKTPGQNLWLTVLTSIVPFILMIVLFLFMFNQQGGSGKVLNFNKSRARLYNEDKKKVNFKDVAGAEEEKQELVEVVDFLKDPRKFAAVGARIPKGVLLVGPPGTGKTLLARAVAGEAGVPFFTISGSDFVEMFVGVGASRVRDLFENAKKNSPCIIFIDEIDAVGRQRGAGLGGGHDEREQTLNQLLVEMDGFGAHEGIIIIAATNRPDILDPALLRPGRFDRQITVDRPDVKGREAVLKVHARNKPMNDNVKLDTIAKRTTGFTGADLENLLNEAALLAARRDLKTINMLEVEEAIDRVIVGTEKKSRVISDREKRIVAYHEAGHTIAGYFLPNADSVHKVTIIPRGRAGGYVIMLPKEDRMLVTKPELLDRVTGLLAGRAAEEIFIGEIGTGAYSDFKQATSIVRSMIMEYGMSEKLGNMQFGNSKGQVFLGRDIGHEQNYSDKIAYAIDQEMQEITRDCYNRAKKLLSEKTKEMHCIANTLLQMETLDLEQIKSLIETGKLPKEDPEIEKECKVPPSEVVSESEVPGNVKVRINTREEEEKTDV